MAAQDTLVSVDEYLRTSYEGPDREYIDGRVVERNLGEKDHSRPQRKLIGFFISLESTLGAYAFPEQRVQVKATRFRVPDVCVYIGSEPGEQVFRTPPFLVVEILSKDDRAGDLQDKLDDYRHFGVAFVWVVDPGARRGNTYDLEDGFKMQPGLHTRKPDIELPVGQLFE
jgi:Uma2 family endonuclease